MWRHHVIPIRFLLVGCIDLHGQTSLTARSSQSIPLLGFTAG